MTFSAQSIGSMFGLYFRPTPPATFAEVMQSDKERFNRFFHAMLKAAFTSPPRLTRRASCRRRTAAADRRTLEAARAAAA